ncbi:Uncharacterized protein Fot_10894 [Forsythia ovata]|uniref:Uncharacterized protein n=1 Tax=Forsythia ovata TaxID=205694 RepID=A0ABD1WI58_9LAMI
MSYAEDDSHNPSDLRTDSDISGEVQSSLERDGEVEQRSKIAIYPPASTSEPEITRIHLGRALPKEKSKKKQGQSFAGVYSASKPYVGSHSYVHNGGCGNDGSCDETGMNHILILGRHSPSLIVDLIGFNCAYSQMKHNGSTNYPECYAWLRFPPTVATCWWLCQSRFLSDRPLFNYFSRGRVLMTSVCR